MTGKERIMATLEGRETDRVSWSPLVDPYFTNSLPEQGYPEMDTIDFLRSIGADIILRHVHTYDVVHDNTIEVARDDNGEGVITTIATPVGNVTMEHRRDGKTMFKTKSYITEIEDVRVMKHVVEHTSFEPRFEEFMKVANRIGNDGIATVSLPTTPIQQLFMVDAGIETTTYLICDYPDEMREFFNAMHAKNLEVYRLVAAAPEEFKVTFMYENTSTTTMSPAWFEEFCLPYINDYADTMHEGGKIFIAHMCGKLTGMLGALPKCRVDGFDSVCPPTTGDLDACDALSNLPGKIIIGGIEPPGLQRMTKDEAVATARRVLDECGENRKRLILSTGDATAYGTPVENLQAIADLVKKY